MRILQWLILGLPWVVIPWALHDPWIQPKEAVLQVGLWTFILLSLRSPVTLHLWHRPSAMWFGVWVVASGMGHYWWALLMSTSAPVFNPLPTFAVLVGLFFIWLLRSQYLMRYDLQVRLTSWVVWSSVLISAVALGQFLGLHHGLFGTNETQRFFARSMTAGFGNVGYLVILLAMALPLTLIFRSRWMLLAGGLMGLILICSHARYAQVAVVGGLICYGWLRLARRYRSHRWFLPLSFLIFLGAIGFLAPIAWMWLRSDERYAIWHMTWLAWQQHAWLGSGIGDFFVTFYAKWPQTFQHLVSTYPIIPYSRWAWAHNDLLQVLRELGIIGMIPLVCWGAMLLRDAFRKVMMAKPPHDVLHTGWLSAFIVLLLLSGTYMPWHLATSALFGLVIVAMCEAPIGTGGGV